MKGIDLSGAFNAASKENERRDRLAVAQKAGVKLDCDLIRDSVGNKATPVSACFGWEPVPNRPFVAFQQGGRVNDPSSRCTVPDAPPDVAALRKRAADQAASGQLSTAIGTYRQALEAAPDHPAILSDLGRLALRMGEPAMAEALFERVYEADPSDPEAADNLAQALREQARYDDAVAVLRTVLNASPAEPILWNTLGTIVNAQGDSAAALIYFDEALRLVPHFAAARYNRAGVLMDQGQTLAALTECEAALAIAEASPDGGKLGDMAMMRLGRAMMLLSLGRLAEGWPIYEARLDPALPDSPTFEIPCSRLSADEPLADLNLLTMGEQGLGDEVLFASLVPDLLQALGPRGRLTLTAEPRLVPLFARSFPAAQVIAHATVHQEGRTRRTIPDTSAVATCDAWTPIASLLTRLRPRIESFKADAAYLHPDPARVAFWRSALATAPAGRKIGLTWRSGLLTSKRRRGYAALPLWREALTTPDLQWVQLQYGECEAELAAAEAEFGMTFWRPPGIDLREDLDDLAALSTALDLVIGAPNATTSLAAACGAQTWFVTGPGGWIQLGTQRHPWYPNARLFIAPSFGASTSEDDGWTPILADVARALRS
jgi:tetratricopeptide (TPR) repeat protein